MDPEKSNNRQYLNNGHPNRGYIGTKYTKMFAIKMLVVTTHRLAYLYCQCDASLDMKLALGLVVARNER